MTNYAVQEQNQDLVSLLAAHFRLLYNPTHAMADAVGMLQMFPGIVGIWPGSVTNGTGQMIDVSGNALHLTNNNNPLFGYNTNTLIPRVQYNGTNQYHSRTDEAVFDITGTEAHVATVQRGLTLGAWVRFDVTAASTEMIISKWLGGANLSYNINRISSGVLRFSISNDGSTTINLDTTDVMAASTPYFVCARFMPSTQTMVRINGTSVTNAISVPASLFSGTANFLIGANGAGANFIDGGITLAFLCAAAVPNQIINAYYQMTAPLFGVSI